MKRIETSSSLRAASECLKLYNWKYVRLYESADYNKNIVFGSLKHKFVETKNLGKTNDQAAEETRVLAEEYQKEFPDNAEDIAREQYKAVRIGGAWERYWSDQESAFANSDIEFVDVEQKWAVDVSPNHELQGVRDGYLRQKSSGNHYLYELKTASASGKDAYIRELESNAQVSNNLIALAEEEKQATGVVYDIVWKPAIRQRTKETLEEFTERYCDEYVNEPAKYFERVIITRTHEQLKAHAEDVVSMFELLDQEAYPRKQSSCMSYGKLCPFYEACWSGNEDMLTKFKRRETKHREVK